MEILIIIIQAIVITALIIAIRAKKRIFKKENEILKIRLQALKFKLELYNYSLLSYLQAIDNYRFILNLRRRKNEKLKTFFNYAKKKEKAAKQLETEINEYIEYINND